MADNTRITFPAFCECGDHAWKPVSKGFVTLVDGADAQFLEQSLHAMLSKKLVYARHGSNAFLHRQVLCAALGEEVDHVNHNGLDNRRSNLRACVRSQNQRNSRKTLRPTTSSFKGVSFDQGKWRVMIKGDHGSVFLGRFTSELEAAKVYDAASVKMHGVYGLTNAESGLL